jgi:glutathione S-transferase
VLRLVTLAKSGLLPSALYNDLKEKAPNFYRWANAVAEHPSVTGIFNPQTAVDQAKKRIAKARGQTA